MLIDDSLTIARGPEIYMTEQVEIRGNGWDYPIMARFRNRGYFQHMLSLLRVRQKYPRFQNKAVIG